MEKAEHSAFFMQGFRHGIPICLGYMSVSFAFGIFTVNQGFAVWQAVFISMVNVTSAGQLAGVPIIAGKLPFIEMALSQFIINLRYSLMSVSLSQKLDSSVTFLDRFLIAFVNTDEVFAVASGQKNLVNRWYMFGLIVMPYIGWTLGTALGAFAGNILPQIVTNALGIAIYGMFIAIIIPPSKKNVAVAGVVLMSSLMSMVFKFVKLLNCVSSGFVIIICAVCSAILFAFLAPIKTR
ncbi:MAG: AzlC family ABC transporter permease [Treponema sp.]|jgi:4-azaleucine resistance transporter AzlC|nr:AzlC family ABC transporter permease [Treponema sp.]